ncbi:ATPase [Streptomyces sp. NBRC 14336]|uniref:AAA family ATPase n=1 Tax=Streptomyces sp. NBRC 14336 TaxID=3030992 RepID=UPI0024A256B9|nr:AAA family ATPase [Streptomyces sp. NBRC 14336]WBO80878.1 AAA family ATPase [Streptomyces sp. SBE_14.2]GLW48136.1 ATPase [Streptomyces sp. NBRC 14336]
MNHRILGLTVRNFRTLTDVKLPLGPLTVMVGPNAAGKSNVFHALEFLRGVCEDGIEKALEQRGGFDAVAFRGGSRQASRMTIEVEGVWSPFASQEHPDRYELSVNRRSAPAGGHVLFRQERFTQHPQQGTETSVDLKSAAATVVSPLAQDGLKDTTDLDRLASALHQPLTWSTGSPTGRAVKEIKRHLSEIRVFDPDVRKAREPSPISRSGRHLEDDAGNLADFLKTLRAIRDDQGSHHIWETLLEDVRAVVPHIRDIHVVDTPGTYDHVSVELEEEGLRGRTRLEDASFGTVRVLCLLAIFHDPEPPALTCIEEIDHGIHPHALELLAVRLRQASRRAQFLVTTHSPVFVSELTPDEFVVCERDADGASRIPALTPDEVREVIEASEGMPIGELWFANTLGGGL